MSEAQSGPAIGTRIRERRLKLGVKQGALAQAVGISGSYLNLIEHNRRRIGGKVLNDLARALGVDPAGLTDGAGAGLAEGLQTAAARIGDSSAEIGEIEELVARFPGWAGLVASQSRRIDALEATVASLRDRLTNDPVLSDAMHGVLSGVTAIRSTAEILVEDPDLAPAWRGRFHRNLNEEAGRLSDNATAMLRHFETQGPQEQAALAPLEAVEAVFERRGHFLPELEIGGSAAVDAVLAAIPEAKGALRPSIETWLRRYAEDAGRLPLVAFWTTAKSADFDPSALLEIAGGDAALVLRRLACLPDRPEGLAQVGRVLSPHGLEAPMPGSVPAFGLAIVDGAGALIFRRRLTEVGLPFHSGGCPLWPLYHVLGRPGQPERATVVLPEGTSLLAWAVSGARIGTGFGDRVKTEAVMLLRAGGEGDGAPVGTTCRICPRRDCSARREPRLI